MKKKKGTIKNPKSTRPWQHVLEPLFGYKRMSMSLSRKKILNGQSFNFGPSNNKIYKVIDLAKLEILMTSNKTSNKKNKSFKETKIFKLNSYKAKKFLIGRLNLIDTRCPNIFQIGIRIILIERTCVILL